MGARRLVPIKVEGGPAAIIASQTAQLEEMDVVIFEQAKQIEELEPLVIKWRPIMERTGCLFADYQALRAFIQETADEECEYKDNCPPFGTRHYQCRPCKAREILKNHAP